MSSISKISANQWLREDGQFGMIWSLWDLHKSFLHARYKPTQYSISLNIKERDRRRTAKNLHSGIIMIVDLAKNITNEDYWYQRKLLCL
jgi:hypothetical protein